MGTNAKKYIAAASVLVGSSVGAGVLGIPYVAAQAGILATIIYLLIIGGMIYLVNLYLGEIVLRTKGTHQVIGYAEKYLGKKARHVMEFAFVFGIYAALIAYIIGMGQSFSQIFTGGGEFSVYFSVGIGLLMALLLKGGIGVFKKFEKNGVLIVLLLLLVIIFSFASRISMDNFVLINFSSILLPFGVILFSMMGLHSIPDMKIILRRSGKKLKKAIRIGTFTSIGFYVLFAFVVVGYKGVETPQVATLALGPIFVFLGVLTMFTSYLAGGNALRESFEFDERFGGNASWFLASIVPIILFLIMQTTEFFSFTRIMSIGGVVSMGIMAIMILLMVKRSKRHCSRTPEYVVPSNWIIIVLLILVFLFGIYQELFL